MSSVPESQVKPLSGQALDRLELMLESGRPGWEPMPLDMLQGYLFGVAAAPVGITPDEWLPRALGSEEWPEARSEADAESGEWIDLLLRYYHQQLRALQGEEDVELVTYEDTPGASHRYELWCTGFLDAIDLAGAEWEALADPEELDELLFPFRVLADALPPGERERYPDKEWARLQAECSEDLWPAVNDAARYGLALRNRPSTVKRDAPKTGRNDPCPCGSGRKFKACCGRTQ